MNGVTILDVIEIYQIAGWQFFIGFSPVIIAAIIVFIRLYLAFKKGTKEEQKRGVINLNYWSPKEFWPLIVGTIISLATLLYIGNTYPADYVETRYEVKIDDSAFFNEIYNTYSIIEERENTFIVKERNKNE